MADLPTSAGAAPGPPATPAALPQDLAAPPPGFAPHTRRSPLTDPWEPLFACLDGHTVQLGLRVREAHCNSRGFAHGGLVSALADNAMGLSAVGAARAEAASPSRPAPTGAVTVSLSLDFIASAGIGDWLSVRPVVLRQGRTLAFVECHVWAQAPAGAGGLQPDAEDRRVARASATFRFT